AGPLPDHEADAVVAKLQDGVHPDGAEVFFRHEREHRLLVVLRGAGLDPALTDTDPQREGVAPLDPQPLEPEAKHTAELVTELVAQAQNVLAGEPNANGILLRGFDTHRELPGFAERYGPRRCRRDLPDVPRHRPAARDGRARPAHDTDRRAAGPTRRLGGLRLLLRPPQGDGFRRRGRRPPPQ